MLNKIKPHLWLLPVLLFFGTIYCLESLYNFVNLRNYGWDMGLFNHQIYSYAHLHLNNPTLMRPNPLTNTLGDHFDLIPVFLSPLYWIFGEPTLLYVQITMILLGGIGIYTFFFKISSDKKFALITAIYFYSIWGIYSALSFDYHENVISAMIVPWLFYFVHFNKWKQAFIALIFIIIAKENMALWGTFICIGMMLVYRKDKPKLKPLAFGAAFTLVYFLTIMKIVIPALNSGGPEYYHNSYNVLGPDFGEVIKRIIKDPGFAFGLLFENPTSNQALFGIKTQLHFTFLVSGGLLLLFKPEFFVMLIPIYCQKLWNDDPGRWGIEGHYSIEFVPVMAIGIFMWIYELGSKWKQYALGLITVAACMFTTYKIITNWDHKSFNAVNYNFLSPEHYKRQFDVKAVKNDLKKIPADASVSAQSVLIPPLAFRKVIYHFPYVGDAEYIALIPVDESVYPLTRPEFDNEVAKLRSDSTWQIFLETNELLILKRK